MANSPRQQNTGTATLRPPVVAVLGHIDHGKSTLLDYIRKANVVGSEAGGITQHLGAYEVVVPSGGSQKKITFLDTPGHEAFGAIRSRGARVADIALLIVAADDGVKTQTLEALSVIKQSAIPYIVVLTKVDREGAQPERVYNQLAEHQVYLEGRGGTVPYAAVNAKEGSGVPELLELILLVAEVSELGAHLDEPASGFVIESFVHKTKGTTGTILIKNGTLEVGMVVATHDAIAPVRFMEDSHGERVPTATFSAPVQITGWSAVPEVGSSFVAFYSKHEAEAYQQEREATAIEDSDSAAASPNDEERMLIPIVVKADTQGGVDAVVYEIEKLKNASSDRVRIRVVYTGVGIITERDIKAAGASEHALVVGFHTQSDASARELAERNDVPLRTFEIIYELVEWLEKEIAARTPKQTVEEVHGQLKVLKTFSATGKKQVIGGRVIRGTLTKKDTVRVSRRDNILGTGTIIQLQKHKSDIATVSEDDECGMSVESKIEIAPGDILEATKLVER